MDETLFWRQKLIQFFHDPVYKPLTGYSFTGKHTEAAKKYARLCIEHPVYTNKFTKPADWAAAGADRPVLNPPGKGKYNRPISWYRHPLVAHPLASSRHHIQLQRVADAPQNAENQGDSEIRPVDLVWKNIAEAEQAALKIGESVQGWRDSNAATLKNDYLRLYRHLPDELIRQQGQQALWSLLPADTRCPDHSIWDHLKVTCALNHLLHEPDPTDRKTAWLPPAREPWLLRFSLGPVGAFIRQARTGRDLWTASYLLSDLVWQAIEVFAEHYGPDAIVYPDLRGNPRADYWLDTAHELMPDENPNSLAATIPNAFVALIPRGGDGHLKKLEDQIEAAEQAIRDRWRTLRQTVFDWLDGLQPVLGDGWKTIWNRQDQLPLRIAWNAIPWRKPEPVADPASLVGPALPSGKTDAPSPADADREAIRQRAERLKPWVPQPAWTAYEQARAIFATLNLGHVQNERGFDYALTHHQLGARHHLDKQIPEPLSDQGEPGEKCTLCGQREALWDQSAADSQGIDGRRSQVRAFWTHPKLDPDQTGSERLCAVCAVKRFLVEAGHDGNRLTGLTPTWAGPKTPYDSVVDPRLNKVRQPFPSTSMIAAQTFLVELGKRAAQLTGEIDAVIRACRAANRQRSAFPDALPQLAPLHRGGPLHDFLEYDPQDTLFPTTLEGELARLRAAGNTSEARHIQQMQTAVNHLLSEAARLKIEPPETRIAVIKIDGDRMGELLLGGSERMGAAWRDVLHPEIIDRIVDEDPDNPFARADWPELFSAKRLMGPSLHAFISRALGHFAHRIVPWVVEREFSGRLIYAGGDDVLCIAPADESAAIAARLQQLWSAAWVIDRGNPDDKVNGYHSEWSWRLPGWTGRYDQQQARQRFQIPKPADDQPIQWPIVKANQLAPHTSGPAFPEISPQQPLNGEILPMPGPAQSLSAGIAYAHFKTGMSHLVRTAEQLLDTLAKERAGRSAIAVKLFSRNAEKAEFALKWSADPQSGNAPIHAHKLLESVISGFRKGDIPARTPYKLREQLRLIGLTDAWRDPQQRKALMRGMLGNALDNAVAKRQRNDLLALWEAGAALAPDTPENSVDGLLFCRAMATNAGEEE